MNKKSFTPGKWVSEPGEQGEFNIVCATSSKTASNVVAWGVLPHNAAAIAALPDLVAALERFVSMCPSDEGLGGFAPVSAFWVAAVAARSALAKSRGES